MGIQKNFVVRNGIEVNNNLIFADSDSGKVGIATTNVQYTLHVNGGIGATSINVSNAVITGITTAKDLIINGRVTAGSSLGIAGQYLISTGTGVTWAALPSVRTVDTQTASASQTIFTTQYLVGLLDVYINGVRLSSDEYAANNSINVVLDSPCFGGETVEFVSYSSVSPGAGFTGIQGLTILEEGVQVGSPLQVTSINFVGSDVIATGSGIAVTVYSQSSQWETVASGIHTSSNVGIGTTNPQSTLEVNGRIGFTTYITDNYGVANNILIGDEATGVSLQQQAAVNNIFVGRSAGKFTTTGNENIFIGLYAGECNTSGSHNNFIGVGAGRTSVDGCFNNFIGWSAGYYSNSGWSNNFFGSSAGVYNSYGNSNNFIGESSGYNNTTGSLNNFFGFNAGLGNYVGYENNFIGYYAGSANQSGSNNIYIGSKTGLSTISSYKIILGNGSGYNYFDSPNVEADKQFAVGLNTTGTAEYWLVGNENFNVGIGTTNPTTTLHVQGTIGFGAGDNIKLGDSETGKSITSGTDNFFAGIGAGSSTSSGSENIFLGKWSGYCNTLGNENIFLGRGSGYYNTIGYNNIFFGTYAGRYNTEGVDNIFIGDSSGSSNIDGDFNNFFGKNSGYGNTSGIGNNFFGCSSGACNVSGNYNTFFGDQAGCSNTIGSNNVVIGNSRQTPIIDGSNQLAIGAGSTDWIVGNSSYNVGIGTTNPQYKLDVGGDINFTGTLYQNGVAFSGGGGGSSQWETVASGISTSSNVGIGTTNPTSKLTVVGNVNVSGIISATSFVGDGSGLTGVSGSSGVNGFVLSYMF